MCRYEPVEVAQASDQDSSWVPSFGGLKGTSSWWGIMYLIWPGNASGGAGKHHWREVHQLYLTCCNHNPTLDKQQRTDGNKPTFKFY